MTLEQLDEMMNNGSFHHATYRDFGTIWEGLYIYVKHDNRRGFLPGGVFGKNDPNLNAAESKVRHTGVSFGAYGNG